MLVFYKNFMFSHVSDYAIQLYDDLPRNCWSYKSRYVCDETIEKLPITDSDKFWLETSKFDTLIAAVIFFFEWFIILIISGGLLKTSSPKENTNSPTINVYKDNDEYIKYKWNEYAKYK